ncbi:hypothetical protein SNOG_04823 [Parastagonospora nodorum SN15]|uniref:Uncharacterized protein n=1 Tax=Phaeosphaeria nodorum (strain SN15 / ATCC MYA-4574 / FGSC 10173) TaxID=321614 RepID=Q0UTU1_PHANO|nr:hypothetical protein SNOG_04823 [Parastagonospora nodorum SN15]EAT87214.1 hypothetical protein SNOG_04823 [Parastagonospora nodorum SN15]
MTQFRRPSIQSTSLVMDFANMDSRFQDIPRAPHDHGSDLQQAPPL